MNLLSMSRAERWLRIQLARLCGHTRQAELLSAYAGVTGVTGWWSLSSQVELYRRQVEAEWSSLGLDAVICPASTFPATKRNSAEVLLR